jgi:hypothetical protein
MTSYRRINSRTINRDVQQQDNMVYFNKPLSQAIYPNYFSVPDASNTCLLVSKGSPYSATAAPQLTFDGITLDASSNLKIRGTTSVQKLNVFGNLDVSGNTDLSGNLAIGGNVTANGTILARQFLPGQVINVSMLGSADIPQGDISVLGRVDGSTPRTTPLFFYSYTPKYTTSYLLIEYQSKFDLGGTSSSDSAQAGIFVDDVQQSYTFQNFDPLDTDRTCMMFPIVGRYTNSSTTPKSISVKIISLCDDTITVKGDTSTWLKITEIGR